MMEDIAAEIPNLGNKAHFSLIAQSQSFSFSMCLTGSVVQTVWNQSVKNYTTCVDNINDRRQS